MAKSALLLCLASTLAMTGLVAFVQVVHYPLFARVEATAFGVYHGEHVRRTGWVVGLPMLVELLTAAYLVYDRPPAVPSWLAWVGLIAVLETWAVTALWSVPAHESLAGGFDPATGRSLVLSNGVRLAGWAVHSVVVLAMAARAMGERP